jgi:hypothetical protein
VEPAGNKEEKMLNYDIGIALGETSIYLASVGDPDLQHPQKYGSGSGSGARCYWAYQIQIH